MESNEAQLALHEQFLTWFDSHKQHVTWGTVAVALTALVVGSVITYRNSREQNASDALSRLTSSSSGAKIDSADALLKIATDYPGTSAGIRARLLGAEALFDDGKYTEAQAQFESFLKDYRDTPYASQASFGVAVCLDAESKTNEAVGAYNDVIKRHPNDSVTARAKLALGRFYEAQAKFTQAKDLYEDLLRTYGNNSPIGAEAFQKMQEFYSQHPELFPAKTASTATTPTSAVATPETTTTVTAPAANQAPAGGTKP